MSLIGIHQKVQSQRQGGVLVESFSNSGGASVKMDVSNQSPDKKQHLSELFKEQ
jgi:hypothetical protein